MYEHNVIAVDLAKTVFQVCVLDKTNKPLSNRTIRANQFANYLSKQKPSLVAFEACSRAQHWARKAQHMGHQVLILPAHIVSAFRQGQKTDGNDALAIALTARQPTIKPAGIKTLEQQSLQSDLRIQQHLSDQLTATGNMVRSLLAEFGVEIPKGARHLKAQLPLILEDAENELPLMVREGLQTAWMLWQYQAEQLQKMKKLLDSRSNQHEVCKRLMKLSGVGPSNALGLYVELGNGHHYKNGRNASACIGVTPKQHSSGGNVKIGHIGKYCGNQRLRSTLITGAYSVIMQLEKRAPRNSLEEWLMRLIERRGKGRAAVALANKTVRTAWAMLRHNQAYQAPQPAV